MASANIGWPILQYTDAEAEGRSRGKGRGKRHRGTRQRLKSEGKPRRLGCVECGRSKSSPKSNGGDISSDRFRGGATAFAEKPPLSRGSHRCRGARPQPATAVAVLGHDTTLEPVTARTGPETPLPCLLRHSLSNVHNSAFCANISFSQDQVVTYGIDGHLWSYFLLLFAASIRRHEASRFASLFQAPYNSRFGVSPCFEAGYCH